MKKMMLTALIFSASVCTAFAQGQKADASENLAVVKNADQKSMMAKQAQEWQNLLVAELKLTDEQISKIAELNKAFGERRQSIANNTELAGEVKRERIGALLKAKDAQFMQLLSETQQARYKELVEAKKTAEGSKKEG